MFCKFEQTCFAINSSQRACYPPRAVVHGDSQAAAAPPGGEDADANTVGSPLQSGLVLSLSTLPYIPSFLGSVYGESYRISVFKPGARLGMDHIQDAAVQR